LFYFCSKRWPKKRGDEVIGPNTEKVEVAAEAHTWSITVISPSYAQSSASTTESSSDSKTSAEQNEDVSLSRKIWQGFTGQTIVTTPTPTSPQPNKD